MKDDDKIRLLGAVAINACNMYIERTFKDKDYESYSPEEKLRIIRVLKKSSKLYARYKA